MGVNKGGKKKEKEKEKKPSFLSISFRGKELKRRKCCDRAVFSCPSAK